ncbi:hypothetical protein FQN54_006080 [Arachnomyces sp. PD_36]|nr:hypothetical protein FQN54_006080 [Arachnomyces sp. PD_36]
MSLRIAPPATHQTTTSNTSGSAPHPTAGAPSAPGLPDTLRSNLTSPAPSTSSGLSTPSSTHPLESRLLHWRKTQDALKMENQRRVYGIAEPLRRGMELKIVREGAWRPAALSGGNGLGGSVGGVGNVQEDILVIGGRDTEVGWEDIFGGDESREPIGFHSEMEQRLKMEW